MVSQIMRQEKTVIAMVTILTPRKTSFENSAFFFAAAAAFKCREKLREQQELFLVQGVGAAIALGEATAKAVQRIPDAHCNGDMHAALEYAAKVKHEQKDFLTEQGIGALFD